MRVVRKCLYSNVVKSRFLINRYFEFLIGERIFRGFVKRVEFEFYYVFRFGGGLVGNLEDRRIFGLYRECVFSKS